MNILLSDIYQLLTTMNLRKIWYKNEELAKSHYIENGYELISKNYTIRWWEIDLLMRKWNELIAIEVKTVDAIDELDNYITPKKIWFLKKTLQSFLYENDANWVDTVRMDAVFVKDGKILEIYENITNR